MRYVLDTNIVARLLDGDERVLRHLVDVEPSDVGISLLVFAELERRGRSKSDFDLMIACAALEQRAILVTHDSALKDESIAGLVVEDWLETLT